MSDSHTKEQRSYNMSRIKSKNTRPEILVRKFLFNEGYRYRINVKSLPGLPDIVLRKYMAVILVNGCFWHGHEDCPLFKLPQSNQTYWKEKIFNNKKRDIKNNEKLRLIGYKIYTIWECELKKKRIDSTFQHLLKFLGKK